MQVIDKGITTSRLLAQVLVAKYADHLPLYRQERIFGRAGLTIPRSTLAAWLAACGVQLQPLVDALRAQFLAHARRKFHDLPEQDRQRLRREKARTITDALHQWMIAQREKVPDGSGTAKALDYGLKRWGETTGCSRAHCAVASAPPPL